MPPFFRTSSFSSNLTTNQTFRLYNRLFPFHNPLVQQMFIESPLVSLYEATDGVFGELESQQEKQTHQQPTL